MRLRTKIIGVIAFGILGVVAAFPWLPEFLYNLAFLGLFCHNYNYLSPTC